MRPWAVGRFAVEFSYFRGILYDNTTDLCLFYGIL